MSDLLLEAMSAKQKGDKNLARQLLSESLVQDPNNETAWMLMSDVVEDVRLRRNCLEKILAINPNNIQAATKLTKLNTSPLGPVTRGERDKPLNPPRMDKVPPFTPRSTWGSDQEQYLPLESAVEPILPGEQPAQPTGSIPTFDWANDSDEPDRTIDLLFAAVSRPETITESLPENGITSFEEKPVQEIPGTIQELPGSSDDSWFDELVGTEVEPLPDQPPGVPIDFTVSAEPVMGVEAFKPPDQTEESVSMGHQLWDNPHAKKDRMVILSSKSLVYASPKESDIPHLMGLFAENKMIRDLLGEDAGVIKLETIRQMTSDPKKAVLAMKYLNKDEKSTRHKLEFSSPQVRDEVLTAIQFKPGISFRKTIQEFRLQDKIVPPLAVLVFLFFLVWFMYAGLPLLSDLNGPELGIFQPIIAAMQGFVAFAGRSNLMLLILVIGLLDIAWLIYNLMKPTTLVILDRNP